MRPSLDGKTMSSNKKIKLSLKYLKFFKIQLREGKRERRREGEGERKKH